MLTVSDGLFRMRGISRLAMNSVVLEMYSAQQRIQFPAPVSAQDGNVAVGRAHTHSSLSLRSLLKVALEAVPMFVWWNTDHSRPRRDLCRPLPFSTSLSFRRSVLWCSGLSLFRKLFKPLSTFALPSCRLDEMSAVLASLSAGLFPLTLA